MQNLTVYPQTFDLPVIIAPQMPCKWFLAADGRIEWPEVLGPVVPDEQTGEPITTRMTSLSSMCFGGRPVLFVRTYEDAATLAGPLP